MSRLSEGQKVGSRFVVIERIGEGGYGEVYRATDTERNGHVALKVLHPGNSGVSDAVKRFQREAEILTSLKNDHIVKFVDAGDSEDPADSTKQFRWIAMEFINGKTLASLFQKGVPNRPFVVREILRQVCHGLGKAHNKKVVHRDLKPGNIMVAVDGLRYHATIVDFGLAILIEAELSAFTNARGTPMYEPPEQALGNGPPALTWDIWPLGLIAFELLTGQHFWLNLEGDYRKEILSTNIPRASTRAKELGAAKFIPNGFDAWFAKCVVHDPKKRFAHAQEAFQALDVILHQAEAPLHAANPALQTAPTEHATIHFARSVLALAIALVVLDIAYAWSDIDGMPLAIMGLVAVLAAVALVFVSPLRLAGGRHLLGLGLVCTALAVWHPWAPKPKLTVSTMSVMHAGFGARDVGVGNDGAVVVNRAAGTADVFVISPKLELKFCRNIVPTWIPPIPSALQTNAHDSTAIVDTNQLADNFHLLVNYTLYGRSLLRAEEVPVRKYLVDFKAKGSP